MALLIDKSDKRDADEQRGAEQDNVDGQRVAVKDLVGCGV